MNRLLLIGLTGLFLFVTPVLSAHEHGQPVSNPTFDKLKTLAGDWTSTQDNQEFLVNFRVSSGGRTVVETLMPGSPYELPTINSVDGKDVVVTHFCAARNQPHMKVTSSKEPNQLVFGFAGGSNIDARKDSFMHDHTITFVDADTVKSEWGFWEGGKAKSTDVFKLKRKI